MEMKTNKKLQRLAEEQEQWIAKKYKSMNINRKKIRPKQKILNSEPIGIHSGAGSVYKAPERNLSNSVGNGFRSSILDQAHRESDRIKQEIFKKASRVGPLYSKGSLQYITDGMDLSTLGKKV